MCIISKKKWAPLSPAQKKCQEKKISTKSTNGEIKQKTSKSSEANDKSKQMVKCNISKKKNISVTSIRLIPSGRIGTLLLSRTTFWRSWIGFFFLTKQNRYFYEKARVLFVETGSVLYWNATLGYFNRNFGRKFNRATLLAAVTFLRLWNTSNFVVVFSISDAAKLIDF